MFYQDQIGETIFIRKDYLEKYIEKKPIKFFSFSERYIPEIGYADETSLHFEIINGMIIKEIPNKVANDYSPEKDNSLCEECKFGIDEKIWMNQREIEKKGAEIQKIIDEVYNNPLSDS